MSSFMEMSLEEIIKKKKGPNIRSKPPINKNKPKNKPNTTNKVPITDARNKIILNKRNQISDAREKLAELAKQKDARLKLDQLRKQRAAVQNQGRKYPQGRHKLVKTTPYRDRVFIDTSRHVVSQPLRNSRPPRQQINTRKFLENRSVEKRLNGNNRLHGNNISAPRILPRPITRTVANDFEIDDPMGEDDELYIAPKSSSLRHANLQLKIVAHNSNSGHSITVHRPIPEREISPPRPPSILKKRPMAASRTEKKPEVTDKSGLEYRIIVSNLRSSVTGGDIEELFGDIGGMVESRLVRPGTAEVIYKTLEDAQRAVDLYHNRQLDGQPMNCLLVTPRPNAVPSRSIAPALFSSNSNVEPDISTFHKVLFNNF